MSCLNLSPSSSSQRSSLKHCISCAAGPIQFSKISSVHSLSLFCTPLLPPQVTLHELQGAQDPQLTSLSVVSKEQISTQTHVNHKTLQVLFYFRMMHTILIILITRYKNNALLDLAVRSMTRLLVFILTVSGSSLDSTSVMACLRTSAPPTPVGPAQGHFFYFSFFSTFICFN